jgi:hypothetical protein
MHFNKNILNIKFLDENTFIIMDGEIKFYDNEFNEIPQCETCDSLYPLFLDISSDKIKNMINIKYKYKNKDYNFRFNNDIICHLIHNKIYIIENGNENDIFYSLDLKKLIRGKINFPLQILNIDKIYLKKFIGIINNSFIFRNKNNIYMWKGLNDKIFTHEVDENINDINIVNNIICINNKYMLFIHNNGFILEDKYIEDINKYYYDPSCIKLYKVINESNEIKTYVVIL